MMGSVMKDRDDLIYDLIFSNQKEFIIDIGEYIPDLYKFDEFISDIKLILKRSKVSIVKNSVDVDSKSVIWKLKVKK
jgi:hypothetical protein